MIYRSQVWGFKEERSEISKEVLKPLKLAQNRCLRRVMGAYKRTPTVTLEREAEIPPLELYTRTTALQRAEKIATHPVEKNIAEALNEVLPAHQYFLSYRYAVSFTLLPMLLPMLLPTGYLLSLTYIVCSRSTSIQ